nr:hypothetical protein [Tanacetum cinerariifolium]GEW83383.1 hypothetical protein [Tanacetum cinerariifolium]
MTSITTQQSKLDLELVPKENRLDIRKCNGRFPRGLKPKKETYQVVLDALALTSCNPAFIITADVPERYLSNFPRIEDQDFDALPSEEDTLSFLKELVHTGVINSLNDVVIDQMHQSWRTFAALINRSLSRKTTAFDKLRLSRAHILWGMYYQKNVDYVELLWENFIYQIDKRGYKKKEKITQMKESKAYKTYLDYATGTVPPKVARKFKKASPSKKDSIPLPEDEEHVQKGKRVNRSAKKSSTTPTIGIVIREPLVKIQSKRKEKVDVSHDKGIDLLSKVALTKETQMKEVRKKSLMDFHMSYPSGSGLVTEKPPSVKKITHPVTSEGSGDKPGVPDVTKDESTENDDDEVKGNDKDDDNDDDKFEVDEYRGMDSDDVQDKKADVGMTNAQREKENVEITQEQVVKDAHVTIIKKTEVPVTSSFCSSDLASKFLSFLDIPPADIEIVSPQDVYVHHEVPRIHTSTLLAVASLDSTIALEKDVTELKNDPLHNQVSTNQLPQILPEEVSNFALPMIEKMIQETLNQVNMAKASSEPQLNYEAAATLTEFELKKILIDKMNSSESYLTAPKHQECYDGLIKYYNLNKDFFSSYDLYSLKCSRDDNDKDEGPFAGSNRGTKSQPKSSGKSIHAEEPEFEVGGTHTPQGHERNQGNDNVKPRTESNFRHDWFTKPSRSQKPTDPDWNEGKTPQKGLSQTWLKTVAASTSTSKSLMEFDELAVSEKLDSENPEGGDYPFDLSKSIPLNTRGNLQKVQVEYFINNDLKYLQGGFSTMTYTTSITKTKAAQYDLSGIKDMKHGYRYLEEIVLRRADNKLYKFKEGDDVADFVIALRMFTKSLVIQKRVKDLQLGVESYQKQINVTKPDATRPDLRKRHSYTPYKNRQGFIYVDNYQRNRLMRSDELYKFSDGTLTRLLSLHEDNTKNIDMKYLPKRRWSTLEKKRAHYMIKYINKLLKERRMMRSLEKFVGGRLYGTDLRLLQITIRLHHIVFISQMSFRIS